MKSLKTLIKLAKAEVDKRQQVLAKAQARQQEFIDLIEKLQGDLKTEGKIADENPEYAEGYGQFAKQAAFSIDKYEAEVEHLEIIIEKRQDELKAAYAEQRKFEIALENREKEIAKEEKKKEQKELDEVASQNFSKKENS